ncbi:MAG: DUF2958 domain-containing protein [Dissulfurispiraceae bacterium]
MELLTKQIVAKFKQIGPQDGVKDPIVIVKFFNSFGRGTWFATKYDAKTNLFYGYVSLFQDSRDEWGYFSLEELESLNHPLAFVKVERDILFEPQRFSKAWKEEMG